MGRVGAEEVRRLALREGVPEDWLSQRIERGTVVVLAARRPGVEPVAVGEGVSVKVNVNVGTSTDLCDPNLELEKARLSVKYGADTVMDLSTAEPIEAVRRALLKELPVPVGTVPIYEAAIRSVSRRGSVVDMTVDDIFNAIEAHAKDGVDFMTIHAGVTKRVVEGLRLHPRVAGVVSRGGAFMAAWILHHGEENPLYSNFDYLLEQAREYGFAISLGDGLRPGCLADANDWAQMAELLEVASLVKRAMRAGVPVIVEGPGHVPLSQVEASVRVAKSLTNNAPLYTLGPLVTDVAPGYDHIALAIGGAVAAAAGADFLCAVYRSEHLGLPLLEDVRESVVATKIAAHVGDTVRLGERAMRRDREISEARARLDWEAQFKLALDPEEARRIHSRVPSKGPACSVCGRYCVYLILSRYLGPRARGG
ncbi:MAG: phosphomethylpyrimidine synthase ThiC [Candidatus Nezhaarchaeales archaeon]